MSQETLLALSPLVLACGLAFDASAAQRTFVASNGLDTNPCTIALPCRSFAYALTLTDSGGEIVALNAAGYGAVVITQSVTITTNSGFFAGIAASTGSAVQIVAPGLNVVLRGLELNGTGATTGIEMADAGTLTVENCVISGFTSNGIAVTAPATVRIVDTIVRRNGSEGVGDGILVSGGATASLNGVSANYNARAGIAAKDATGLVTQVNVMASDSSHNSYGFLSHANAMGTANMAIHQSSATGNNIAGVGVVGGTAQVSASHITSNVVGLSNDSGTLNSGGNNYIRANGTFSSGTIGAFMLN